MALVLPFMLALIFGSMELGNFFLSEHALVKQVRDGARFASRLKLADGYACPTAVFEDPGAETLIENVTRTGSLAGGTDYRRPFAAGATACGGAADTVTVSVRCADPDAYGGVWADLDGDIPVVSVDGAVTYNSILGTLGFSDGGLCLRAQSEVPAAGA
jgi:hypothetical protein